MKIMNQTNHYVVGYVEYFHHHFFEMCIDGLQLKMIEDLCDTLGYRRFPAFVRKGRIGITMKRCLKYDKIYFERQ